MKKSIVISVSILSLSAIIIALIVSFFRVHDDRDVLTLFGNVDVRQVDISFRVAGQVNALYFEEGDQVKKGDLMCTLDEAPYNSKLVESIAAAESVAADLINAEILLKRREELLPSGGVSQEDYDNALSTRNQLSAQLVTAKASIQVEQDNLLFTKAYAPTDAIVLTRIREPGTVVNPTDPVFSLSVTSPVWIRAFVSEPNLGKVYYGMRAKVITDSGRRYEGNVGFISPVAEFTPKSVQTLQLRTDLVYRLRIYVENPDHGLLQGMPVTVELHE